MAFVKPGVVAERWRNIKLSAYLLTLRCRLNTTILVMRGTHAG